ncbi:DUF6273 domain-containing protein, partial [Eubacteriales bacterium OttesenSCG-928-N14]|nr:DUF6273 domain-containing protein [Eubacteriales bacterium OttesenSCG-928-N14]
MKKAARKMLSGALALAMMVCAVFALPVTTSAAMPTSTVGAVYDGVDFSANAGSLLHPDSYIYYGIYDHLLYNSGTAAKEGTARPVLWRMMGEEINGSSQGDGYITYMSQYVLDRMAFFPYTVNRFSDEATYGYVNGWDTSQLYAFLNNKPFTGQSSNGSTDWTATPVDYTSTGFLNGFTASELGLVPSVNVKAGTDTGSNSDNAYPSSAQSQFYLGWEYYLPAGNIGWGADDAVTTTNLFGGGTQGNLLGYFKDSPGANPDFWWLRSPAALSNTAWFMYTDGSTAGTLVNSAHGIRPAFKLNPTSVIFASEIGGSGAGATPADGANYFAAAGGAKNFKLTVLNSASTETLTGVPSGAHPFDSANSTFTVNGLAASQTGTDYTINYKVVAEGASGREIVQYGSEPATSNSLDIDISGF